MRQLESFWFLGAALLGLAAPATAAPAPASAAFGRYAPPAEFNSSVTTSVYVEMRDGVRLAVSITRPAIDGKPAPGRFPVIWQHTLGIAGPGAEGGPIGTGARAYGYPGVASLARSGYVVAEVARRGNGPSFGRRRGYNDRTEAYDAYEMIDWLASQPWSTGAVGVFGCSNTGDAAMHTVTAGNPHLKAAWAGCFSWEKYDGFLRGGIFANWGTGPERTVEQDMSVTPVEGDEAKVMLRQAAEEHRGATPPLADMWRSMPYRDSWAAGPQSRFWYEGSAASYLPQINRSGTAIYIQGGWFDDLREQGLITFANLKGERRIVIGPWTHCGNGDFDLLAEIHRFFDEHLKGIDTGQSREDPIHYFTINAPAGTEWRSAKTWPIAGGHSERFYLAGAGPTGGALTNQAPKGKGATASFTVRYDVDCPAAKRPDGLLTGAPPCPLKNAGPHFASPVLSHDIEVTGDPIADLWITSSATDGNVFVYLEDVAPDGTVSPVTDARLKASLRRLNSPPYEAYGLPWHRSRAEDAQPLTPGAPARLTIAFLPTSYVFKAGHRIRVSLTGADYREHDRIPVTPAPVLSILDTPDYPSTVSLPVAPSRP
jgi:putative CocE/NonD family hydrolase